MDAGLRWHKSVRSGSAGSCVEVAYLPGAESRCATPRAAVELPYSSPARSGPRSLQASKTASSTCPEPRRPQLAAATGRDLSLVRLPPLSPPGARCQQLGSGRTSEMHDPAQT
jgi:hypothetical protein